MSDPPLPSEDNLEEIQALVTNYKKKHEQLIQEQQELAARRDEQHDVAQKFRQRCIKLTEDLQKDERSHREKLDNETERLRRMKLEEAELMEEILWAEEALGQESAVNVQLRQQTDVFTAVPDKRVVFAGLAGSGAFEMKPRVVYPMDGGTLLITFEEEAVAKKVLHMKRHRVDLGSECSITMEARPVQLLMPTLVEIDSEVSPQHILISDLPKMDTEKLLNKLEIHFSKSKHGGGEVDKCEMLHDSGTVVLSFVENNIAKGLTDTEHHKVELQEKMHRVRVTPFINGRITNLQTKMAVCPRTVLLTGIPAIMERENLQDLLEIHFQKSSNGGGEIVAVLYNPLGQRTSALFEGVAAGNKEE